MTEKMTEKIKVGSPQLGTKHWVDPRSLDFPHDVSDEFCFLYVGQSFDFDTDDRLFSLSRKLSYCRNHIVMRLNKGVTS